MPRQQAADRDIPLPIGVVTDVAARVGVDEDRLADALRTIHAELVDDVDDLFEDYANDSTGRPPPITANHGTAEVLFVDQETWEGLSERLGLPDDVGHAARVAHAVFAHKLGVDEGDVADSAPLVVPAQDVAALVRAGLSRRQAEVQMLRELGFTQETISGFLDVEVGTVKSHCYRIDEKVDEAARLLELVGSTTPVEPT